MEKLIKYIDESDDNGNKKTETIQKEDSENNINKKTEDNLYNEIKLIPKENNIDEEENSESLEIIVDDNLDNKNRNDIIN